MSARGPCPPVTARLAAGQEVLMRTAILLTVAALLAPTAATAQSQSDIQTSVDDGFVEPGLFGITDGTAPPFGVIAAVAGGVHITTGPPTTYVRLASTERTETKFLEVTGNYTVKATIRERYLALGNDPEPYGVAIAAEADRATADAIPAWPVTSLLLGLPIRWFDTARGHAPYVGTEAAAKVHGILGARGELCFAGATPRAGRRRCRWLPSVWRAQRGV